MLPEPNKLLNTQPKPSIPERLFGFQLWIFSIVQGLFLASMLIYLLLLIFSAAPDWGTSFAIFYILVYCFLVIPLFTFSVRSALLWRTDHAKAWSIHVSILVLLTIVAFAQLWHAHRPVSAISPITLVGLLYLAAGGWLVLQVKRTQSVPMSWRLHGTKPLVWAGIPVLLALGQLGWFTQADWYSTTIYPMDPVGNHQERGSMLISIDEQSGNYSGPGYKLTNPSLAYESSWLADRYYQSWILQPGSTNHYCPRLALDDFDQGEYSGSEERSDECQGGTTAVISIERHESYREPDQPSEIILRGTFEIPSSK